MASFCLSNYIASLSLGRSGGSENHSMDKAIYEERVKVSSCHFHQVYGSGPAPPLACYVLPSPASFLAISQCLQPCVDILACPNGGGKSSKPHVRILSLLLEAANWVSCVVGGGGEKWKVWRGVQVFCCWLVAYGCCRITSCLSDILSLPNFLFYYHCHLGMVWDLTISSFLRIAGASSCRNITSNWLYLPVAPFIYAKLTS